MTCPFPFTRISKSQFVSIKAKKAARKARRAEKARERLAKAVAKLSDSARETITTAWLEAYAAPGKSRRT